MRMSQYRRPRRLFVSPKCPTAVPVATQLLHDFLTQTSLDPSVDRIELVRTAKCGRTAATTLAVFRDAVRTLVDFGPGAGRPSTCNGEATLPEHVRAEPRLSNCRTIWSHRDVPVSHAERNGVLSILDDEGPSTVSLIARHVAFRGSAFSSLCSLACEGAISIEVAAAPLSGSSIVREARSSARRAMSVHDTL